MQIRNKSAYFALKSRGLKGLLVHLITRSCGDAHYLRPASSVDFKILGMQSFQSVEIMLASLLPNVEKDAINQTISEADNFLNNNLKLAKADSEFPDRWNSGRNLQILLYAFVKLGKISTIVETGTANGASALAISGAIHSQKFGQLYTFDIEKSGAPLVPTELRQYVDFIQTDGSPEFLYNFMCSRLNANERTLFLHDADHSYLGQINDYLVASKLGFSYIFSDDVDTSLAFCDFAGADGGVFYDSPKFIGVMKFEGSNR
jgi:hypothetical protein